MAGLTKDDDETKKMQETSFDLLDDDDLLAVYESDVQKPSHSSIAPTPEKRDTATIVTTVKRKREQEKLPTFNDMIDQRTISEQHHWKQYQQEQQQMEENGKIFWLFGYWLLFTTSFLQVMEGRWKRRIYTISS
jgi:hypothetical protein